MDNVRLAKEQIERWEEMTDRNSHGEVLAEIAAWWQERRPAQCTVDYCGAFSTINKWHHDNGHLTMRMHAFRSFCGDAMFGEIKMFEPGIANELMRFM